MILKFSHNDFYLFYIDSYTYISKLFKSQFKHNKNFNFTVMWFLFDVRTPFLMDGEAKKLHYKLNNANITISSKLIKEFYEDYFSQKGKKNTSGVSQNKIEVDCVKKKFLEIQNSTSYTNHFELFPTLDDISFNNVLSRRAKELFLSLIDSDLYLSSFKGSNESEETRLFQINGHTYLIPPKSRYVNGNVFDLKSHFKDEKFDLVLVDPPWINKHVRRRKKLKGIIDSYSMMSVEEVLKIPLASVLTDDSLVLFWVTNSTSIMEDLLRMLKTWDLELVTTWYWLKVTKAGNPVIGLDTSPNGKLPYEKLLLTQRRNSKIKISSDIKELLFCSTPCSIHSHKPPLKELLFHTLNVDDTWRCLELFARSLNSNWTSFGNEVLKFQDISILDTFTDLNK
ncbi:UNVERIFIED_CONTAM: hypothetical protein RMT77_012147 [Armadillidium vulgare]|nr:Methyltransferase-like protein 4 [Armadillidium vulgare]